MFRQPFLSILAASLIAALATAQGSVGTEPDRNAKGLDPTAGSVGVEPDRDSKGLDPDARAKDLDGVAASASRAGSVGIEPDRDSKGLDPDAGAKDLDGVAASARSAGSVGIEPDRDSKGLDPDAGAKDLDGAAASASRAGSVGIEPDRDSKGLDPDAGAKDLDGTAPDAQAARDRDLDSGLDAKDPDDSSTARKVYKIFDDGQLASCVTVDSYGQRHLGEDMSRYGKVLKLSFRMANERIGRVEVAGGVPNAPFALVMGMARDELRLPWGDTALVARILNIASGTFAGDGKAILTLNMALDAVPLIETNIFMQAFALLDRPVSSHGLHFAVCGRDRAKDTFDLDPDAATGEARKVKDLDEFRGELRRIVGLDTEWRAVDLDRVGDRTGKGVGTIGTDFYSTYPFEALLAMTSGDARYWLAAWVRVPTSGFELRHDNTFERAGEIHVLFSVVAPSPAERVAQVFETHDRMVEIPAIEGKRVLVFVADRVRGSGDDANYMIGAAF
jgi:hypothetical protein